MGQGGASYTPSASTTLYAQWTANSYTVTYNYDGGTGGPGSAIYTVGGSSLTLPTPTEFGYTFSGWFTNSSGGSLVGQGGASYTPSASTTLYAQWTANSYTVTYNYDGGTGGPGSAIYTVGGSSLTLPTPTEFGYTFSGWFTNSSGGSLVGQGGASYTPSASTTLYAQWTANSYTVTYNYDGGTGGPGSAIYTVGGSSLTLPTPTEFGYTFSGWFTNSSGGSLVGQGGASYTPSASTTLYAQWTANSYTVTYNYDGGTGGPGSAIYTVGGSSLTLPTPTEFGYTFSGWFTNSSGGSLVGQGGASYTPSASTTLYAQWTANSYTVTYNYDGGTGGPGSAIYTVGGSSLTLPTPTEFGYTFSGWFTNSSGGSLVGQGGASYTPSASTTLYAQWTANSYTVTYNYDGGTGGPGSAIYTVGGSSLTLPTPTEFGYTFSGWFTSSSGGSLVGQGGASYTPSASTTLYAQWTANSYTVTYNYDGGTGGPGSAIYTVGGSSLTLPTPTEFGYTFSGWFTSSSGGSLVGQGGASYTPSGSTTLYAQWTPTALLTNTIAFGAAPTGVTFGEAAGTHSVHATATSGTIAYTSLTPSVCTVNATRGALTIIGSGSCEIQASETGQAPATSSRPLLTRRSPSHPLRC